MAKDMSAALDSLGYQIEALSRQLVQLRSELDSDTVPKWRKLVDEAYIDYAINDMSLLFYSCYLIEYEEDKYEIQAALARIVTLCERAVGNDWQVEIENYYNPYPTVFKMMSEFCRQPFDTTALETPTASHWKGLARYAASWLRQLAG